MTDSEEGFPSFPRLPPELRDRIWCLALSDWSLVYYSEHKTRIDWEHQTRYRSTGYDAFAAARACREARAVNDSLELFEPLEYKVDPVTLAYRSALSGLSGFSSSSSSSSSSGGIIKVIAYPGYTRFKGHINFARHVVFLGAQTTKGHIYDKIPEEMRALIQHVVINPSSMQQLHKALRELTPAHDKNNDEYGKRLRTIVIAVPGGLEMNWSWKTQWTQLVRKSIVEVDFARLSHVLDQEDDDTEALWKAMDVPPTTWPHLSHGHNGNHGFEYGPPRIFLRDTAELRHPRSESCAQS